MTDSLPTPLVDAEVDLRDFQYMELDVRRIRDSRIVATVDGEEFRAAFLLWCASWHQVPAASVPDDDIELASLAGYGRVVREWKKVRAGALYGFVKCSDGRLYHPTVAEKALQAWDSKLRHQHTKLIERLRKTNKARESQGLRTVRIPTFEEWKSGGRADPVPPEESNFPPEPPVPSAGIPPENALRGNGEGTERERNGEKNDGDARAHACEGTPGSDPPAGAVVVDPAVRSRRAIEIVAFCRRRSINVTGTNPDVLAWAEEGFSDEQIAAAIDIAVEQRRAAGSMQSVGTKYLDTILREGAAQSPAPKRPRRESTDEHNRRAVDAWLRGEATSDDGRTIDA